MSIAELTLDGNDQDEVHDDALNSALFSELLSVNAEAGEAFDFAPSDDDEDDVAEDDDEELDEDDLDVDDDEEEDEDDEVSLESLAEDEEED
jgi:hypothetical protein